MSHNLAQDTINHLIKQGAALVGFADLSPIDESQSHGFPMAISFCVALQPSIVADIADGPTEEYSAEYVRLNSQIGLMGRDMADLLKNRGWKALACPATGDWDPATLRAPFQHKTAATLAGHGWIGKCALLITPTYGPAIRWGSVLTDAPFPAGTPQTESQCGDCTACVNICPGRACSGRAWCQGMAREEFWDPKACMAGMRKVSMARLHRAGICGMCIAACPYTRAYLRRSGVPVKQPPPLT